MQDGTMALTGTLVNAWNFDRCVLLEPFRVGHKYATLDPISMLNYAVDVTDGGSHRAQISHVVQCPAP